MDVNKDTLNKDISEFLNRKIIKNIKEDDDNIETNFEKLNRNEFKSKKINKFRYRNKNYKDNYNSYNNNTSNNNKNLNYKNYNNTSDYDKMKKI